MCGLASWLTSGWVVVFLSGIGASVVTGAFTVGVYKALSRIHLVVGLFGGVIVFIFVGFFSLFLIMAKLETLSHPIASQYFPLNAAVKNTCFLDPTKAHCPHTLNELIAIQPEKLAPLLNGAKTAYVYYPDTNEYTLVIKRGVLGVVFDPALAGYDFTDLNFSCPKVKPSYKENMSDANWEKYLQVRATSWPKLIDQMD